MAESALICRVTPKGLVFDWNEFEAYIGAQSAQILLRNLKVSKTKRMGQKYQTKVSNFYKIVSMIKPSRSNVESPTMLLLLARFTREQVREAVTTARLKRSLTTKMSVSMQLSPGDNIDPDKLEPGPVLDTNQTAVLTHLMDAIYTPERAKKGLASCTLVMGTGTGKSYVAAALIGELGKKTLVIAPSDAVLDETRKALQASYPNLILGEYTGKRKSDGDVVLTIINSALNQTFELGNQVVPFHQYFSRFGLVVFDEIHNYTSEGRQEIFWRTNMMYGLGLTATPDENTWDMDAVFQKHVGPLVRESDIPNYNMEMTNWKGIVHPIYYHGPSSHTAVLRNPTTGWVSHGLMVDQFSSDPHRTNYIINKLLELWSMGLNVFVFVLTRAYATKLAREFKQTFETMTLSRTETLRVQDRPDAVILMGGSTNNELRTAQSASIIFTTYGFGWQGVSIPKMDTIIFANPRIAKMRQIIGRIIRKSGDSTITRNIYDIVDAETKMGLDEYRERKKFYGASTIIKFDILEPVHHHAL